MHSLYKLDSPRILLHTERTRNIANIDGSNVKFLATTTGCCEGWVPN
jgi:hypothetical protein